MSSGVIVNGKNDSLSKKETVYGPKPRLKSTYADVLQDYYDFVVCWVVTIMLFLGTPFLILLGVLPLFWPISILYLLWLYYDRNTPHVGGRKYRRDYFPIRLVKTSELPPNTTYLFCSFPHGLLAFGASTNFLCDVNNFDEAFPGLEPYVMTLNVNFNFPLARDMLLAFGVCAASHQGIMSILKGPPGNVCILVVGGIAEALKAIPGTYRLVLKNRKGFVKTALQSGSSLVPVFSFGENDTYDQISGKWYLWLQGKLRSTTGIPFVIPRGRSLLGYRILPYKRPITTVVGKPLKLPKVEDPSKELIDEYHQKFTNELVNLFETNKRKYDSQGEKATLILE